jgi:glyceraldehyde 3-phosphate dehydrogenase
VYNFPNKLSIKRLEKGTFVKIYKFIKMANKTSFDKEIQFQTKKNRATVEFIKIINDLWYEDTVELLLFRNQLIDKNVTEILHILKSASNFVNKPISIFDVVDIARVIRSSAIQAARIDIGKLAFECLSKKNACDDKIAFIKSELIDADKAVEFKPKDVVLYGFGRIGRLLARELMIQSGSGKQLRLRAIVTRGELNETVLEKRASLLRDDSVHDDFPGTVSIDVENKALIINGISIHMISSNAPDTIDYTKYGIKEALVIDNTGVWRDRAGMGLHLKSKGVSKVLLTAPAKEDIPNIVYGVNQDEFDLDKEDLFSAASCTTNAITPVLKAIEDTFGIKHGHLETIHAYTNDQNLVDNFHKKYRRGRAAAVNMVITSTGAGNAVAKAIPSLKGKFTSSAIRVPVPNGSLAILNLQINKKATLEDVNEVIKKYALEGDLVEQIKYSMNNELVSSDIIGVGAPAIYDSNATIASVENNKVILYVWYDNEYGYAQQVIRLSKHIAKVRRFAYY